MAHVIATTAPLSRIRCGAARVGDIDGVAISRTITITTTTGTTGTFTTGTSGCGGETD